MPKPKEYTDTFIIAYMLFLVGLHGRQYELKHPVESETHSKKGNLFRDVAWRLPIVT